MFSVKTEYCAGRADVAAAVPENLSLITREELTMFCMNLAK